MNELEKTEKALNEDLKPCPFCGCESIHLLTNKKLYYYSCKDCDATGGFSASERIACWAWQKRVT